MVLVSDCVYWRREEMTHFKCLVDADLVHKLDEELQYEKSNEETGQPEFVKEFLEANSFKVGCC